jgi:hypothetical protein
MINYILQEIRRYYRIPALTPDLATVFIATYIASSCECCD